MPEAVWLKLIDVLPALAWVAFATLIYRTIKAPLIHEVLPKLSQVRGLGIELSFAEQLIDKAAEARGEPDGGTARERRGVLRRLDHAAPYLRGARILWVDDHPENNTYLVQLFQQVGMTVALAESAKEALRKLERRRYDLVITDVRRGDEPDAGVRMLREFRSLGIKLPVVIFAGDYDPTRGVDRLVFGHTNRIDDVIHYVIDIVERSRIG